MAELGVKYLVLDIASPEIDCPIVREQREALNSGADGV